LAGLLIDGLQVEHAVGPCGTARLGERRHRRKQGETAAGSPASPGCLMHEKVHVACP
jgi:hypothetical protein